jgi:hypothetical protein
MVAHWADFSDPAYLSFIDEAKPEIVQVGFYGAHFWSLADTAEGSGYPAHFPVRGHRECGAWFARLNQDLHKRGAKVVGHLNVKFLVGDPAGPGGPRGFFRFYREQWDEKVLGPKPVADPLELLEKDKTGQPISQKGYAIGGMREYWGCLNNPAWRAVLKAWVRYAINQGVDGLIANYFYRHDCLCPHCVSAFRQYLRERFGPTELENQFSISNLESQEFAEIVGWHDPAQSSPLRREMLRFSQIANKRAFDEVFLRYGRSLKPDLIVAQWNHLGDFNQISGDERCLLPADLWGRDEDYLWYSTGDAANRTDLKAGKFGDATLQARYIRGAFQDKPFTLGKYESVRTRAAIAELAANGGAPMGFYTNFKDPDARREIIRYYNFLREHEGLYRGNGTASEVLLLFPRRRVWEGELDAVARFKEIGARLLDAHVLFDILPDDLAGPEARKRYSAVVEVSASATNVLSSPPVDRSGFEAPAAVRVSASRPAGIDEITVHFVNYNRQEPDARKQGAGLKDEKPIATPIIPAGLKLPPGFRVARVEFLTPEQNGGRNLEFEQTNGRLQVRVPSFLVYGVLRIQRGK